MNWLAMTLLTILAAETSRDDAPPSRPPSDQTYRARWSPQWEIAVDGSLADPHWSQAAVDARFGFPWQPTASPATEFRALADKESLYFAFRIEDADIFVLDKWRGEEDAVFEDRAEIYFVRDEQMREYYCLEVDSRGRTFDYRGAFYRRLDPAWELKGRETAGRAGERGYAVEGKIPLSSLESLGFPRLEPGAKIRWGLYRAEFSHDRSGRPVKQVETKHNRGRQIDGPPPIEKWISWVDPQTPDPDFHVPASLGWLEIVN